MEAAGVSENFRGNADESILMNKKAKRWGNEKWPKYAFSGQIAHLT